MTIFLTRIVTSNPTTLDESVYSHLAIILLFDYFTLTF